MVCVAVYGAVKWQGVQNEDLPDSVDLPEVSFVNCPAQTTRPAAANVHCLSRCDDPERPSSHRKRQIESDNRISLAKEHHMEWRGVTVYREQTLTVSDIGQKSETMPQLLAHLASDFLYESIKEN
ncbi:hypothetical protein JZ751_021694, partial [Albula glossodonta]